METRRPRGELSRKILLLRADDELSVVFVYGLDVDLARFTRKPFSQLPQSFLGIRGLDVRRVQGRVSGKHERHAVDLHGAARGIISFASVR